ncbi:hypothetical protein ACFYKX_26510 [Cytobacillus sp. FJAT-54145]|uniref:Uncharacterized protein n=1 Tax=Cytobacillus spartinae TaxID=3299023 RepID=A0ABW6KIQ1_9BACI
MPYIESETKAKIREIRNSSEPVLNGFTDDLEHYEVSKDHFRWLLEQAEKIEKYENAIKKIEEAIDF